MKITKDKLEKRNVTPPNPDTVARKAADLVNQLDDQDAVRVFWDNLDEPTRENLLTWFAEWDKKFCEALNPSL